MLLHPIVAMVLTVYFTGACNHHAISTVNYAADGLKVMQGVCAAIKLRLSAMLGDSCI